MSRTGLPLACLWWYTASMGMEPDRQASVRILVLSDESLFNLGVQNLLGRYPTLEILSCDTGEEEVAAHLQSFQPDVVVLNMAQQQGAQAAEWLRVLRDRPGIRLLGLSLEDSTVCIYRGETQQVKEVGDLLRAIERSTTESPAPAASLPKPGGGQN